MPPPLPPRVKAGPNDPADSCRSAAPTASASSRGRRDAGGANASRQCDSMACLNRSDGLPPFQSPQGWRRSAPPRSFSRVPSFRQRATARFRAVCPPMVGSRASGRSCSITRRHHIRGKGFDISAIRHVRIGHDRGGVAVHQHHLKTLGSATLYTPGFPSNQIRRPVRSQSGLTPAAGCDADPCDGA